MKKDLFVLLLTFFFLFNCSIANAQEKQNALPNDISSKILGTWTEKYGLSSWTFNANGTITDKVLHLSDLSFK